MSGLAGGTGFGFAGLYFFDQTWGSIAPVVSLLRQLC